MKHFTESEVDTLIEDLTVAAEEAIEKAAAEAAKAAVLAGLEREAASLAQAHYWAKETQRWEGEYRNTKKSGIRNAMITGVVCFLSGIVIGAGSIFIIGGR
jgi:hypothetical protein